MADSENQPDSAETVESPEPDVGRLTLLLSWLAASPWRMAVPAAVILLISALISWLITGQDGPTPREELRQALALLDVPNSPDAWQKARRIALRLRGMDYRDPDSAWATEFILGIVAFREAERLGDVARDRDYVQSVSYLRETEGRALDAARRPEWSYALGTSLHQIGLSSDARPLLEEAYRSYLPSRVETAARLIEIYLDLKTSETLQQALNLSDDMLAVDDLTPQQRDDAHLRRAWILLAMDRKEDAQEALRHVSHATSTNHDTVVLHAQILMAEKKYAEARQLLRPVAVDHGLDQTFSRQASYLMGVCAEQLGNFDVAISDHKRTAKKWEESHEGLAANLRLADLLQKEGWDEQALNAHRRALSSVTRPENFRNRWLSLDSFREAVEAAWNSWVESGKFEHAIELSRMMTPLLPEVQAYELAARANQHWAEHLEQHVDQTPFSQLGTLKRQTIDRWRLSGKAYAELASAMRTSSRYPDKLWISAEHFRKGHDFQSALTQLTRFINTQPKTLLPLAYVRRGQVLMELDRLDESLDHFWHVLETYPTDPAAFEARYTLGKCHLERDEPLKAEETWRSILNSPRLAPAANEWRLALFSLGRLQFHRASRLKTEFDRSVDDASLAKPEQELSEQWNETIRRLDEYLKRYSDSAEAVEARYLHAKALQHSADLPRRKLQYAETQNARMELNRSIKSLLRRAQNGFQRLHAQLLSLDGAGRLDKLGERMLRNCFFEIAHTLYAVEDYQQAIVAYSAAANRYPQDPQVLLAYVQMTNCYDRLNKPAEARGMLEQAKVIIKQMPEDVFQPKSTKTNLTRVEWKSWLEKAIQLRRNETADSSVEG